MGALRFRLFGFPVEIQLGFWILAIIIGLRPGRPWTDAALWLGIIFVSIMVHELGHAFAARAYGQSPSIVLHMLGGLTSWAATHELSKKRRILVTLAGPGAGFALGFVAYGAPHSPWKGHPQDLVDAYMKTPFDSIPKDPPHPWSITPASFYGHKENLAQYFAAVSGVDRNVERILKGLDDMKLAENTLVVFTSDQGFNVGHHGLWGKGNASNPRNMYDTSMQIPLIFRQPGRVPRGKETDALFSAYDFVPTVLDYMGLPPSPGRNLPGKSFASVIRGEKADGPADAVFGEYGRARMIRTDRWKLVHRCDGGPDELYDLQADPGEKTNLIDKPELRKTMIELRGRIFEWFERYTEIGTDPVGNEYLRPADKD